MSFALLTGAMKSIGKISASKWKGFAQGMKASGETAKTDIAGSFMRLASSMNPLTAIIEPMAEIFEVYSGIIEGAFMPLINKLFDVMFSESVIGIIVKITEVFTVLIEAFLPFFDILIVIINIIVEMISVALDPLMTIFQALFPVILVIVEAILPLFDIFKEFIPIIEFLANVFVAILLPILEFLIPIIEFLAGVLKFLFNVIADSIIPIFETIITVFKFMANVFIEILNFIIGIINGVLAVITLGAVQIPTIPKLAEGGIITKPTLILAGEKGPEKIIPLNQDEGGRGGDNLALEFQMREFNNKMDILIEKIEIRGDFF